MRVLHLEVLSLFGTLFILVVPCLPPTAFGASWEDESPKAVKAFEQGNLRAVKQILEEDNYYNVPKDLESTPPTKIQALHYALTSGNVELVKYLASLGWLEECGKWSDHCQPIRSAAGRGRVNMMKYLMSVGFDVKSGPGYTPLHDAARGGHVEAVKFLCEQGVDDKVKVTSRYESGSTALDFARNTLSTKGLDPNPKEETRIRANLAKVIEYLESGQCKKK